MTKPLTDMSFAELSEALHEAQLAEAAADYQESLDAWTIAKVTAGTRLKEVQAEIDLRLSRLGAAGGVPVEGDVHGG